MKKILILITTLLVLTGCTINQPKALVTKAGLKTFEAEKLSSIHQGYMEFNIPDEFLLNDLEKQFLSKNNKIPFEIHMKQDKERESKYQSDIFINVAGTPYHLRGFYENKQVHIGNQKGLLNVTKDIQQSINTLDELLLIEQRFLLHAMDNLNKDWFSKGKEKEWIGDGENKIETEVVTLNLNNEEMKTFLAQFISSICKDQKIPEILFNKKPITREFMEDKETEYLNKLEELSEKYVFEQVVAKFNIDDSGYLRNITYSIKLKNKSVQNDGLSFTINGKVLFNSIDNKNILISKPSNYKEYQNIYDLLLDILLKKAQ